jgi:hypothetical protein
MFISFFTGSTETDRNLLFDAGRFRENCFRVLFICGDFTPPQAGVKLWLRFCGMGGERGF